MNWLKTLNDIEKQIMAAVPSPGAIKHAINKDSAEVWQKVINASADAEQKADEMLAQLRKEVDVGAHSLIENIYQSILLARNAKIQECVELLQASESDEVKELAATLAVKIVPTRAAVESSELPAELVEKVPGANANGFNRVV